MKHCIILTTCIAVSGCGLLFGSYEEKPLEYVEIYKSADQIQQVRILSRVNLSGGAHNPFDASEQTYISSTWVPLEGSPPSFSVPAAGKESYCPVTIKTYAAIPIRGSVIVSGSTATLALQVPKGRTAGGEQIWAPHRFNGQYRVVFPSVRPEDTLTKDSTCYRYLA